MTRGNQEIGRRRSCTCKFPRIIGIQIEIGDDVGVAGQEGSLAVEEVDDELFVGRAEPEAGRQVHVVISHAARSILPRAAGKQPAVKLPKQSKRSNTSTAHANQSHTYTRI